MLTSSCRIYKVNKALRGASRQVQEGCIEQRRKIHMGPMETLEPMLKASPLSLQHLKDVGQSMYSTLVLISLEKVPGHSVVVWSGKALAQHCRRAHSEDKKGQELHCKSMASAQVACVLWILLLTSEECSIPIMSGRDNVFSQEVGREKRAKPEEIFRIWPVT